MPADEAGGVHELGAFDAAGGDERGVAQPTPRLEDMNSVTRLVTTSGYTVCSCASGPYTPSSVTTAPLRCPSKSRAHAELFF